MAVEHRYAFAKSVAVALAKQAGSQSCPILLDFAEHPARKVMVKDGKTR
jgi:hypothetical protein